MSQDIRKNIYHTTFTSTLNRGKSQDEATEAAKKAVADFDVAFPAEPPKAE